MAQISAGHDDDRLRVRQPVASAALVGLLVFTQLGPLLVLSIPDWGVTPFAAASGRDVAAIARELDAYNDYLTRLHQKDT